MSLSEKEVRLVQLVATIVLGKWERVTELRHGAPSGEPDREWREAVLQTHLFAGFPRLVEAYGVLAHAGGLGALEPGETRSEPDLPDRGAELFETIYGEQTDLVRDTLENHHPDFARWIAGHAYGRVLTRPGLSAAKRELCAVAALVALGQDRQLASHARGAVRCGATPESVMGVVDAIAGDVSPERIERARNVVVRFGRGE
ncbi:MAG: hypothetical protein GY711_27635 [bacterium]|nr:hypothetical protein [bacterium]